MGDDLLQGTEFGKPLTGETCALFLGDLFGESGNLDGIVKSPIGTNLVIIISDFIGIFADGTGIIVFPKWFSDLQGDVVFVLVTD